MTFPKIYYSTCFITFHVVSIYVAITITYILKLFTGATAFPPQLFAVGFVT